MKYTDFTPKIVSGEAFKEEEIRFNIRLDENVNFSENKMVFSKCIFHEDVIFENCNFKNSFEFIDCKFKKRLEFIRCISQLIDIRFISSEIEYLCLNNNTSFGVLEFENCLKCSFLIFYQPLFKQIILNKTVFSNHFQINDGYVENLHFCESIFECEVNINSIYIRNGWNIENCHFKKQLIYNSNEDSNSTINTFVLISTIFDDLFYLNGASKTIQKIEIQGSNQLVGRINFDCINIDLLTIEGVNERSNISFNQCNIEKIFFNRFNNYSTIIFSNIKALSDNSSIRIFESNLGKTSFYNFNFKSFKTISIESSLVSEIQTANIEWFTPNQFSTFTDTKNRKEVFRQLKFASEKQSNRIDALMFQAWEMNEYKNELISKEQFFGINRLILWLSQTNDFGQNWKKPIWILLLVTLVFYPFYVVGISENLSYLTPNFSLESFYTTLHELYNNFKIIPQLLDPTHSLSKITETDIKSFTYWIDYIYKTILVFLLFQTISAFRKLWK